MALEIISNILFSHISYGLLKLSISNKLFLTSEICLSLNFLLFKRVENAFNKFFLFKSLLTTSLIIILLFKIFKIFANLILIKNEKIKKVKKLSLYRTIWGINRF